MVNEEEMFYLFEDTNFLLVFFVVFLLFRQKVQILSELK
jgi:hypothetical protein